MSDAGAKPGSVVYELQYPVQFGTESITHLTLRRPKGKDVRAVKTDSPGIAETIDLIGRLSAQPRAVVDELDAVDIDKLSGIIEGFTKSGRPTGAEPAP